MADTKNGKEEDWEYESEDGEDYSWEYEEEDETPEKKQPEIKEDPEDRLARVLDEYDTKETETKKKTVAEPVEEYSEEEDIVEEKKEPNGRMERSDRNAIMEQMKRLQEGFIEDIEVGDSDYSLTESDEEDTKPPKKQPPKKVDIDDDDIDLSDLDLLDPFGSEPVPVIKKKESKTNGNSKDDRDDDKKHRKHRRKSKHSDKIEKFRLLESKDTEDREDENKLKKIHVRSKDPRKIAKQFEKHEKSSSKGKTHSNGARKPAPKPPAQEINKICKGCGKEPYMAEKLVAEKSWWHKNCFRCSECNKLLTLDTYASHQGIIYCKPHHKDLFKPKAVVNDPIEDIRRMKELDFSVYNEKGGEHVVERHRKQERRMETIVRENKPVELEGVVKSKVDGAKWDGLDQLDVGSKFMMFEKAAEEKESKLSSDRYGIMEKLKRLQEGEDVAELLAEIDDEMPSEEEEDYDPDDDGLTQVQKKAHHAEKLFNEDEKKKERDDKRKLEIKKLREKLMAGHRDSAMDSFDELNHRKVQKTKVDVRSENAKKFMNMFNKGEVPEGMNAGDRTTLEKDMELEMMRSKKRGERDFFKNMEKGGPQDDAPKEPKLLIGKLKTANGHGEAENGNTDGEAMSKKFSFFENYTEEQDKKAENGKDEKLAGVKECKAGAVINKFKDMERRVANGEDPEDTVRRPVLKRFTPPRKLGEESGSEYSDSDYSDSDYSDSADYSSDSRDGEEDEYLKNVREAARAKQLRAKFEEWEAGLGEDGGYTNLVDENGLPLETASKLKNRFEQLAVVEPSPEKQQRRQVKRFKPKEAYEHQEA